MAVHHSHSVQMTYAGDVVTAECRCGWIEACGEPEIAGPQVHGLAIEHVQLNVDNSAPIQETA